MKRFIFYATAAFLLCVAPTMAQQKSPSDAKAARVARTVIDELKAAFGKRDATAVAAAYTADATISLPDGQFVKGRAAIEKYVSGLVGGSSAHFDYDLKEAHAVGRGVWALLATQFTVTTPSGPKTLHYHSAYVFVPQGHDWKASLFIAGQDVSPPPPPPVSGPPPSDSK